MSSEDGFLLGYGFSDDRRSDSAGLDTASQMVRLWQIPAEQQVPDRWSIPRYPLVSLGVASANPEKINAAKRIFSRHGGRHFVAMSSPEENILRLLTPNADAANAAMISGAGAAEGIVRGIAALKPLAAFLGNPRITHGLGLDTDIAVMNQANFSPVGKADSWIDLHLKLQGMSGQFIKIVSASVLADMYLRRPVAAEIVSIFLKLRTFEPDAYIRDMGITNPGATSGGIDLANPAIIPYVDDAVYARVNRMDVFHPEDRHQHVFREVQVPAHLVPLHLGDIVRGVDEHQIETTIYNGLVRPQAYPVAL